MTRPTLASTWGNAAYTLLLVAGLAKAVDVPAFHASLSAWTILPQGLSGVIAVTVPLVEIAIGLAGILGLARSIIWIAGVLFVLSLLCVSVAQQVTGAPPRCSCFGQLSRAFPGDSFPVMLGMSLFMLAGLLAYPATNSAHTPRKSTRPVDSRQIATRGFTLIETILVVLLFGILISLTIPIFSRSRDRSREAVVLSDLRTHATNITHYTFDHKEFFPYILHTEGMTVVRCSSQSVAVPIRYFEYSRMWHVHLADEFYDGDLFHRTFESPFEPKTPRDEWKYAWTSYFFPCVFFTRPEYWDPLTRLEPTSQFGATRASEVVYPAMKSLMVEYLFGPRPEPAPGGIKRRFVSFVDGHARAADQSDDLVMRGGDGTIDVTVRYLGHAPGHFWPFQHTLYGVRGRDTR